MSTAPKNQDALRFGAGQRPARQPKSGEHLWTVRTAKGALIRCELRDHGPAGVELQLYHNREFVDGRRWPSRAVALDKGEMLKADHLLCGAILVD